MVWHNKQLVWHPIHRKSSTDQTDDQTRDPTPVFEWESCYQEAARENNLWPCGSFTGNVLMRTSNKQPGTLFVDFLLRILRYERKKRKSLTTKSQPYGHATETHLLNHLHSSLTYTCVCLTWLFWFPWAVLATRSSKFWCAAFGMALSASCSKCSPW